MNAQGPSLLDEVAAFIADNELLAEDTRVVTGVSGGADSMALLDILHRLGYGVVAVHVNYRLRGPASDADERHVRQFCEQYDIPLYVYLRPATPSEGASTQMIARELRYEAFVEAARQQAADVVAVAHHADDQAETVLLNLIRGTGPEGLAGMPVRRRLAPGMSLVRPMLNQRRAAIEEYLEQRQIAWREDATNATLTYRRGVIRNQVVPFLDRHFGPDVAGRIERSGRLMREYVEVSFRPELERRLAAAAGSEPHTLSTAALRAQPAVWRRRLLLEAAGRWLPGRVPASEAVARHLEDIVAGQPGRRLPLGDGVVWNDRLVVRFVGKHADGGSKGLLSAFSEEVLLRQGTVRLDRADRAPKDIRSTGPLVEYVDGGRLAMPVAVRPWRAGDRMRPLGMHGRRLVSDILTDEKVAPSRRQDVLVIEDQIGIVWLVGFRIDERLRITSETSVIAKLSFNPAQTAG